MNLLFRVFAVGSLLTAAHTFAATAFEGKVTLTMTGEKGESHDLNYIIKGHKMRMDMPMPKAEAADSDNAPAKEKPKKSRRLLPGLLGGKPSAPDEGDAPSDSSKPQSASTIMDMDKMEMTMLMPEQKMYMVMPIKKAVDKVVEHAEKNGMNAEVERTGKTEKILGYTCDQILVKDLDRGTVTEMWVATELGTFGGLAPSGGGGGMFGGRKSATAAKWEEVLKGKGGFPMRVITRNAKNMDKETFKMEATKIEPGELPDSLFLPPPGFQKFQMPSFGDLLKGGN